MRHLFHLLHVLVGIAAVAAQSSAPPTPSPTLSLSLTTSSATITTTTRIRNQNSVLTTAILSVFNVTYTVSASASSSTPSASTTPQPIVLETRLDPAFGVLGAILILTGLPSAFWGHKNRWYARMYPECPTQLTICIQDLILPHRLLHLFSVLYRPHTEVRCHERCQSPQQDAQGNVRFIVFYCRYSGRCDRDLLLEGGAILYRGMGG